MYHKPYTLVPVHVWPCTLIYRAGTELIDKLYAACMGAIIIVKGALRQLCTRTHGRTGTALYNYVL